MYSREQIIREIKRIADMKGGNIRQEDFELHSTIPMTTVRFHLGSWPKAVKEAGVIPGKSGSGDKKNVPRSDTELLQDLIRLNEDSGQVPTLAVIESKGKYSVKHYQDRWKSISEAFLMAQKIFRKSVTPPPMSANFKTMAEPENEIDPYEITDTEKTLVQGRIPDIQEKFADIEEQNPFDIGPPVKTKKAKPEPEEPAADKAEPSEEILPRKEKKIQLIPETIKPKPPGKSGRTSGEPIRFRGLLRAPANKAGVIYMFGLIGYELGFVIKSVMTEYPDCEAKRCVDVQKDKWKRLSIHFEYKSSDFLTRGLDPEDCDLIVCWLHDWHQSPIEVLELRSVVKQLPND